jgi:hypothetical protein
VISGTPQATPPAEATVEDRILVALRKEGLMWRDRLENAVNAPPAEFGQALMLLREGGKVKSRERGQKTLLYIPHTDEYRKAHRERLKIAKGQEQYEALDFIIKNKDYREDYDNLEDFLWHEFGRTLSSWEGEKRTRRNQKVLDERGIPLKLNRAFADALNPLRPHEEFYADAVANFQALPENRQIAKELKAIVQSYLEVIEEMEFLRGTFPDVTVDEAQVLRPMAPHRWPNGAVWSRWKTELTERVKAMAKETGKPAVECLLAVAEKERTLPYNQIVLEFARGKDMPGVVAKLVALRERWKEEAKKAEEDKELERQIRERGWAVLRDDGKVIEVQPEAKKAAILGPTGEPLTEQVAVVETAPKIPEAANPKPKPNVTVTHRYELWVGNNGPEDYADLGDLEYNLEELLESAKNETAKPGDTTTLTFTVKITAAEDANLKVAQDAEARAMLKEQQG